MNEIDFNAVVKSFEHRMRLYKMIEDAKLEWKSITGKKIWYPSGTTEFDNWFDTTYGLRRRHSIQGLAFSEYYIADHKKYTMFLLKFSNEKSNSE